MLYCVLQEKLEQEFFRKSRGEYDAGRIGKVEDCRRGNQAGKVKIRFNGGRNRKNAGLRQGQARGQKTGSRIFVGISSLSYRLRFNQHLHGLQYKEIRL